MIHRHIEFADRQHGLLLGVSPGLLEVEMLHGSERLHVYFSTGRDAVEPPGYEWRVRFETPAPLARAFWVQLPFRR